MLANAKDPDAVKLGNNIILGGLILQVLFFALFLGVAATFHKRMRTDLAAAMSSSFSLLIPWTRYLLILYLASLLIVVRCVFRIAEYAGGQDGVLLSNEVYLYVFEAALMFSVMVIFNVQHPSVIVGRDKISEFRMADLRS
jgi:Na+/H+-dicarboxylate symporter